MKEELRMYRLFAFGSSWKVVYLDGRDAIIDMVISRFNEGDDYENPSSLSKLIFRYSEQLGGYDLIGVMDIEDDSSSLDIIPKVEDVKEPEPEEWNWKNEKILDKRKWR